MKYKIFAIAITTLLTLVSCVKEELDKGGEIRNVLLVYLGGDNNLSGETDAKIEAIKRGWNGNPTNRIIIYQDALNKAPKLSEIVRVNGASELVMIKEFEEENSASAEVLRRVIEELKAEYRSASFGMLLFSHASGWLPEKTLTNPRNTKSLIVDGVKEMELTDMALAIPDKTFDYIVFEMCFMGGIEVAYELRNKTNYILGSSAEIVSPGFTNVYPTAINDLLDKKLEMFAQKAFSFFENQSGWQNSATLSLIKTSEIEPLSRFIKQNADYSMKVDENDIQHFDRYSNYRLFFDFEDYYLKLMPDDATKNELTRLVKRSVIWKASTERFMPDYNGFYIKKHSGLTVYIEQKEFPFLNQEYSKLQWYKDTAK